MKSHCRCAEAPGRPDMDAAATAGHAAAAAEVTACAEIREVVDMPVVETETHGQILVVRMNRPDRLNALNHEMRSLLAEIWTDFREIADLEVAIFTGAGRGFCAGEDIKESLRECAHGGRRPGKEDQFWSGPLRQPVIGANTRT